MSTQAERRRKKTSPQATNRHFLWRRANYLFSIEVFSSIKKKKCDFTNICDYYKNKINSQRHICKQAKSHTYIIYTIRYRNPIPGHISGENHNSKRYMHPNVHCSTIYNSQDMEATWMSINRWKDKEDAIYTHKGILLSHKKKEIMPSAATLTDLEIIILSEKLDKYHISLICGI